MKTKATESEELETDVVVVGYGGAGATAAIAAHDEGARVVVLEKMPTGGGTTSLSGGIILTPTSMEAVRYIETLSSGSTEKEILHTFVEEALKTERWIRELGGEIIPHPAPAEVIYPYPGLHPSAPSGPGYANAPGAQHIVRAVIKGSESELRAQRLWKLLSRNVEQRGIKIMTNCPARELITNEEGDVTGVVAEKAHGQILVKAKRAVILTCGGFEYNEAMREAFLPCKPFYVSGNSGNAGDGIIMAQKVGAALWHMTVLEAKLGFKAPEYPAAFSIYYHHKGFIHVNRQGKRFCDELARDVHDVWRDLSSVDSRKCSPHPCYPNIPAYGVFDDVTRRKGPLHKAKRTAVNSDYEWSLDNSKEIARGWIVQGKTTRELARRLSVDESSLENTVARYNEFCKAGNDADFGRPSETLGPIETPPFYAIPLWPNLLNTQGGPRRDKQARVVNYEGKPIPRLYAAGELGSIWGFLYDGGGNIAECLAFGRIAGRNAAAEKPWS